VCDSCRSRAWNSLGAVSFLSVQLLAVDTLAIQSVKNNFTSIYSILGLYKRVSSWIETKVGLIHQLLVKRRVYCCVVTSRARGSCLLTLEKFGQN